MQMAEDKNAISTVRIAQFAKQIIRLIAVFKLTVNHIRPPGHVEVVQLGEIGSRPKESTSLTPHFRSGGKAVTSQKGLPCSVDAYDSGCCPASPYKTVG
jgi:hypothetical protein